jgi:hypothetical protein
MGYALLAADLIEVASFGEYDGQRIVNVFYGFIKTNGSTTFPVTDGSDTLLLRFRELWEAQVCPLLSNGYSQIAYVAKRVVDNGGAPKAKVLFDATTTLIGTGVGSGGAASLDTFSCVNMQLRTSFFGRSGRGRKAIGPVPESVTVDTAGNGNKLTASADIAFDDAWANIFPDLTVGTGATGFLYRSVIFSRKKYKQGVTFGDTIHEVTSIHPAPRIGSQVSRKAPNR